MITYQPDGGELGRAYKQITPLEFQVILRAIADILDELKDLFPHQHFVYPFEFRAEHKEQVEMVMMSTMLSSNINFYETDGKKIFELRGACGGVVSGLICYLVTR